jgi:hypothetical protein
MLIFAFKSRKISKKPGSKPFSKNAYDFST